MFDVIMFFLALTGAAAWGAFIFVLIYTKISGDKFRKKKLNDSYRNRPGS
jgi:hypothetical protein